MLLYQGSTVPQIHAHPGCRDTVDIDARIKKASAAFGALRHCLFSSKTVSNHAICIAYVGLVLATLLHRSEAHNEETWCLTEVLFNRATSLIPRKMRAYDVPSHDETCPESPDPHNHAASPDRPRVNRHLRVPATATLGRSRCPHALVATPPAVTPGTWTSILGNLP